MNRVMKKEKNNLSHTKLFYILISCVVLLIGIFIMSQKEGMDFDEIGTFGLANNTFQLDIKDYNESEIFNEYGGEELLLKYTAVKEGEEFNVGNVFFNQKMDTHPPLYYLIVNFICSLRKETFSMWYGLIINLFFMVILFWEMRYLFNLVIEDELISTILSLIAFFTYGFVNEIVFIRMYVMLSSISMAFVILIIEIIKSYKNAGVNRTVGASAEIVGASNASPHSKNKFIFVALFFALCVLGILTQYHFMILAFYFSLVLGFFLISKKDFKTLACFVLTGLLAIGASILIFPGMFNHMFGETSLHALNGNQFQSTSRKFYEMIMTIQRSFFGVGIWPYLVILVLALVLITVKRKININSIRNAIVDNKWLFIFLLCCILYFNIVTIASKYSFARYLYNIYPLVLICIIAAPYLLFKNIMPLFKYFSLALLLMLVVTSRIDSNPFSLNIGNNLFYEYLNKNRDIKVLGLYRSVDRKTRIDTQDSSLWKLPRPLYAFRNMKSIFFSDLSKNDNLMYFREEKIAENEALFVVIYTVEDDNEILGGLMRSNGFSQVSKVFDNTYYHMYLISK